MMLDAMDSTGEKGLSALESSEPERSEGERNGGGDNPAVTGGPDPEVVAVPKRRRFSCKYKAAMVQEAQSCTKVGQIGALLRREGLYSSQLTLWRRQYQQGALKALKDDRRGRQPTRDARDDQLDRLRRENARLSKKLSQAETIIDIQKKVAAMLGDPIETPESTESTESS